MHLVQHFVPSEAVTIRAPAQPVHGIPQLGHDTLAIVCWFYVGLTSATTSFFPVRHQSQGIFI
jgi:hypothetical protein